MVEKKYSTTSKENKLFEKRKREIFDKVYTKKKGLIASLKESTKKLQEEGWVF